MEQYIQLYNYETKIQVIFTLTRIMTIKTTGQYLLKVFLHLQRRWLDVDPINMN